MILWKKMGTIMVRAEEVSITMMTQTIFFL